MYTKSAIKEELMEYTTNSMNEDFGRGAAIALTYPVHCRRIKLGYNAISEKLSADDIISKLISEQK